MSGASRVSPVFVERSTCVAVMFGDISRREGSVSVDNKVHEGTAAPLQLSPKPHGNDTPRRFGHTRPQINIVSRVSVPFSVALFLQIWENFPKKERPKTDRKKSDQNQELAVKFDDTIQYLLYSTYMICNTYCTYNMYVCMYVDLRNVNDTVCTVRSTEERRRKRTGPYGTTTASARTIPRWEGTSSADVNRRSLCLTIFLNRYGSTRP